MFSTNFFSMVSVNLNSVDSFLQSKEFENLSSIEMIRLISEKITLSPNNSKLLLSRGIICFEERRYDEACEDFNQVILREPDNLEAKLCKIYSLFSDEKTRDSAVEMILNLHESDQKNAQINFCMGDIFHRKQNYVKALECFRQGALTAPSAKVYEHMGHICLAQNSDEYAEYAEYAECAECAECAVEYYSKSLDMEFSERVLIQRAGMYQRLKQYDNVLRDYEKVLENTDNPGAVYRRRSRLFHFEIKDYDSAVKDYLATLSLNPKAHLALAELGHIYLTIFKKYDEALDYYERAIEIYPRPRYYHMAARLLNIKGLHADALDLIQKGVLHRDKSMQGALLCHRGETRWRMGDHQKALHDLSAGIERIPNQFIGYVFKGGLLCELGKYEKAEACFTRGIIETKGDWFLYEARFRFYRDIRGDVQKALNDISSALELEPQNPFLYLKRSQLFSDYLENFPSALDDIEKALELSPDNHDILAQSAYCICQCRKYEQYPLALKQISRAIEQKLDSWKLYYIRGEILHELGEYESALEDLKYCSVHCRDELIASSADELIEDILCEIEDDLALAS